MSEDSKTQKPVQANASASDRDGNLAPSVDTAPDKADTQTEKPLKKSFFSKFGFRPKGPNTPRIKGIPKKDKKKPQEKKGNSSKEEETKCKPDKEKDGGQNSQSSGGG